MPLCFPARCRSLFTARRRISVISALLEELDGKGRRLRAAERRMAQLLTLLIEDFEEKHYALRASGPVDVLRELILANNLKQKDLLDVFELPALSRKFFMGSASSLRNTSGVLVDGSMCRRRSFFSSLMPWASLSAVPPRGNPARSAGCSFRVEPVRVADHSTAKPTPRDDAF
jgi:hypothetical protein